MLTGLLHCHGIDLLVSGLSPPVVFSMQLPVASETPSLHLYLFLKETFYTLIYIYSCAVFYSYLQLFPKYAWAVASKLGCKNGLSVVYNPANRILGKGCTQVERNKI